LRCGELLSIARCLTKSAGFLAAKSHKAIRMNVAWSSSSSSSRASERATQENFAWQAKSRRLVVGYGVRYSRSFTWVHSSFSIMPSNGC
jgi:hypothetical protein